MQQPVTATSSEAPSTPARPGRWLGNFWAVTLVLSALYISVGASEYLRLSPEEFRFPGQREVYANNWSIMRTHIAAGIVALLAGSLQFVPQLKRFRRWHRAVGLTYASAVALGGGAGLAAAGFAFGGLSNTAAFGLMSLFWLITTAMALFSIARGDVRAHQRWMKRSFAITLAGITLRIELGLLIFAGGLSFEQAYLIVPWTSWVLNLLILEWLTPINRYSLPTPR